MEEKLKKALECCKNNDMCPECPLISELYCREILTAEAENYITELEERIAIMQESMETLEKRNEPVAPVREVGSYSQIFRCRNCDTLMVFQKQKYCHECGQAVKWND